VPGSIGDDESAPSSGEKPVSDIDGYALLPLILKPVQQEREVDAVTGRTETSRVALQRRDLVVEDQPAIMEQPPYQRRFAIVN
jgi:hypothetical protein